MAATVIDNSLFGDAGASDPIVFTPGLIGIRRHVNFGVKNLTGETAYALFGLPKAFVVTGVFIEETKKCSSGNLTLKTLTSDASTDKTIGAAVTVGDSTLARSAKVGTLGTNSFIVLDEGSTVYIYASAAMSTGAVNIVVYGYQPYGDSLGNVVTPAYRASGQSDADAAANRAGVDPYVTAMLGSARASD